MALPFLLELRERLSEANFKTVARALWHNPLLWRALHSPLGKAALQTLGDDLAEWKPAVLAAVAADLPASALPQEFARALLLARRLGEISDKSRDDLSAAIIAEKPPFQRLAAALSIALHADKNDNLAEAVAGSKVGERAYLHALLAQPQTPEALASAIAKFLAMLPPQSALRLLWEVRHSHPEIASKIESPSVSKTPLSYKLWQAAMIAAAAGQNADAHKRFEQARGEFSQSLALLSAQEAELAAERNDFASALEWWKKAFSLLPQNEEYTAGYAFALSEVGENDKARQVLPPTPQKAATLAVWAYVHHFHSPEAARDYALAAAERLPNADVPSYIFNPLVEVLVAVGEMEAAAETALFAAQSSPMDADAFNRAAALLAKTGQHPAAAEAALWATTLEQTPNRLRLLANSAAECCPTVALEAYRQLTAENPRPDDLFNLASLALNHGELDEARDAAEKLLAERPQHAPALAILGRIEIAKGNLKAAKRHLERSVSIEPTPQAYLALAEINRKQEGLSAAVETLQTAIDLLPNHATLHRKLGEFLLQARRPAHALPHLEKAITLEPNDAEATVALAQALAALGKHEELKNLLEGKPEYRQNPEAALLLAQAYLHLGNPHKAKAVIAPHAEKEGASPIHLLAYARALHAVEDYESAAQVAQKAIAALGKPSAGEESTLRADLNTVLADSLLALGKAKTALEVYLAAYGQIPTGEIERKLKVARGLLRAALAAGKSDLAVEVVEETLPFAPHDREFHSLAACAYAAAGLPEKALAAAYNACLLSDFAPDEARAYAQLAVENGKAHEAAEVLQQAVARSPKNYGLRLVLADAFLAAENPSAALAALSPLLDEDAFPEAEVCAEAGKRMLELDAAEQAEQCLRRAVQMQENAPLEWHLELISALRAQKKHQKSAEAARIALSLPEALSNAKASARLHLALAQSLFALGAKDEANNTLQEALKNHPRDAELHREAMLLWRKTGGLRFIVEAAERFLAAEPQNCGLREMAAEAARDLLMPERARRLLAAIPVQGEEAIGCYLLSAELALEAGEEVAAAKMLQKAISAGASGARALFLQARLAERSGDRARAERLFAEARGRLPHQANSALLSAAAEAALELQAWKEANDFAARAAESAPYSPLNFLRVARFTVLTAEAQERAEAVEEIAHAPGKEALGAEAASKWQSALAQAAALLGSSSEATPSAHPVLERWQLRGEAIFHARAADALLHSPWLDDAAAWWSAKRRAGETPNGKTLPERPRLGHHLTAFQVALYLEWLGKPCPALEAAEAAVQAKPRFAEGQTLVARLALGLEKAERAKLAIEAALGIFPDEPRWHTLAARVDEALGNDKSAIQHYTRAAELEPNHLPHRLRLAKAFLKADNRQSALDALRKAESDFPNNAAVYLALAEVLFALGRPMEAATYADEALKLGENSPKALSLRARIAQHLGDHQTALEIAERLRQKEGLTTEAATCLARALSGLGRDSEALQVVEEAIAEADSAPPVDLEVLQARLLSKVAPEEGLEKWRELSEQHQDEPRILLGLAEALADANRPSEAQQAARQALPFADFLAPEEQSRLFLLLGRLAMQEGNLDQAVHYLTKAALAAPQSAEAWLTLGRAEAARGLYKDALEAYAHAREYAPHDPLPYYYAALAAKEIRDFQTAEELLREAARLDPDNLAVQRQLMAVSVINLVHG